MKDKSFAKRLQEAKQRDTYWVAEAIYTFTEELHELAEQKGLSRAELARLLGVSPAYITKIFRGNVNFTIDTMVRLARRVGARLDLHLIPEGLATCSQQWRPASLDYQKTARFQAADSYQNASGWTKDRSGEGDELFAACG